MSEVEESQATGWPLVDDEVSAALKEVYRSGDWGRYRGAAIDRLIVLLAAAFHVRHAIPVCSGTIAVELALRGVGVRAGDEVILAGYDFPGNFRCIEAIGARPVLVDLAPNCWSIDVEQVAEAIGPATKAVVASHLHGDLTDMPALRRLADAHHVALVEDACQSPGGSIDGRPVGAWGDASVLSFGGSKLLTCGRGGAVLTSHDNVRQRIVAFCERGNDAFPLSSLQAAVLPAQLAKLASRNAVRQRAVDRLRVACRGLPAFSLALETANDRRSAYYKVGWRFDPSACGGAGRETILAALTAERAPFGVGFRGFTRRGAARCRRVGELANSRLAAENTLLLHHPILLAGDAEIDRLAAAMWKVAGSYRGSEIMD